MRAIGDAGVLLPTPFLFKIEIIFLTPVNDVNRRVFLGGIVV